MSEPVDVKPPLWIRVAVPVVRSLPLGRYRVMTRLCRGRTERFHFTLPAEAGAQVFVCDLRDEIAREVCFTGRYEPLETALFQRLIRPGATVVDVGANWGYFTLLAAHLVGPHGRVLGLEPDPRHFRRLRDNVALNDLRHVVVLPVAAAARNEGLRLGGFENRASNRGVSSIREPGAAGEVVFDVAGRRLDDLLDDQGVARVDLVKIDVEGYEHRVLEGMEDGLCCGRYRALVVELHPGRLAEQGVDWRVMRARLAGAGYAGWVVNHDRRSRRRAAYTASPEPGRYLTPLVDHLEDEWPHTLWLAPGEATVPQRNALNLQAHD